MRFYWNTIIHSFLLASSVAVAKEHHVKTAQSSSQEEHRTTHHYLRSLFHQNYNSKDLSSNDSKTGVIRKRNLNGNKWLLGPHGVHHGSSGKSFCATTDIKGAHIEDEDLCKAAAEANGYTSSSLVPNGSENNLHGCYIIQSSKKYFFLDSGNNGPAWGQGSVMPLCAKVECEEGKVPDPDDDYRCKTQCEIDGNCTPPTPTPPTQTPPTQTPPTPTPPTQTPPTPTPPTQTPPTPPTTPTPPTQTPPTQTPPTPPTTPTPPTQTPPTPTPPTQTPPTPTPPTLTPACPDGTFRQDSKCLTPCEANSGMCDEETEYCEDAEDPQSINDYECFCNEDLELDPSDGECKVPCNTDPLQFVCGCDAETDSETFKFTRDWFVINGNDPKEADCAYLTKHKDDEFDEKRIGRYCLKPDVKAECSKTCCDFICEDDPDFFFPSLDSENEWYCHYISMPKKQETLDRRRSKFCYEDNGIISDIGVNCPDACGLCGPPPIVPPPSDECTDSKSFEWVLKNGNTQTCDYILKRDDEKDARRVSANCGRGDVKGACKSSCDSCDCDDDESFRFTLIMDPDEERDCDWINARGNPANKKTRRQAYCFADDTCSVPSVVGDACVKACGFCDEDRSDDCEPYPPVPPIDTTCPEPTDEICDSRGTFWYVVTGGSCKWSQGCLPDIAERKDWDCNETGPFDEFSEKGYKIKINGEDPETPPHPDGLYYHGDKIVVTTEETETTIFSIDFAGNTQSVTFHSSCSGHFEISDTYGILTMIGFHNDDGQFGYTVSGVYEGGSESKKK